MGLRCLLGHDFGEREVERDRREDGDEVVVSFRTVETCERCGERRVVSENKEIRPRERGNPAAPGAGDATRPGGDSTGDPGGEGRPPAADGAAANRKTSEPRTDAGGAVGSIVEAAEAGDGGTVIDDDADTESSRPTDDEPEPTASTDGSAERADTTEDDAVILTGDDATETTTDPESGDADDDPDADRDPDREPNLDDAERELGQWPETGEEDEGFDAEPHEDTDSGVEFGGELTPTDDDHAAFIDSPGAEPSTTAEEDGETTFVRPEGGSGPRDVETEYRCPNCGATEATVASSLRAGDICPECHKGYVAERAAGEGGRNA